MCQATLDNAASLRDMVSRYRRGPCKDRTDEQTECEKLLPTVLNDLRGANGLLLTYQGVIVIETGLLLGLLSVPLIGPAVRRLMRPIILRIQTHLATIERVMLSNNQSIARIEHFLEQLPRP